MTPLWLSASGLRSVTVAAVLCSRAVVMLWSSAETQEIPFLFFGCHFAQAAANFVP